MSDEIRFDLMLLYLKGTMSDLVKRTQISRA